MATRKSTAATKVGRILAASAAVQRVVTPCAQAEMVEKNELLANSQALLAVLQAMEAKAPMAQVLAAVNQAFDLAYACYWEVQPNPNVLFYECDSGQVPDEFRNLTRQTQLQEGQGLCGRAWRQRSLVVEYDLAQLADCPRGPLAQKAGMRSALALPIIVQGRVRGVMEYLSTDSAPLSAARQSVWEGIAGLVSTAITAAENAIEQTRASQEARRVRSILENAPVAVMQCNLDLHIEYMNQASFQLLKKIEPELPCRVEEVVGRCIDIFHRHPEKHREMLSDPRNLPHRALIRLGDEHLSLVISALHDEAGTYVGPMLTWELITARMNAEQQKRREAEELAVKVDSLLVHVQAAARGDLTRQIQFEGDNPIDRLGEGLHQLLADFRNSLGEIKHNVLTLSGAAEELTATSKQMQINAVDSSGQVTAASAAGEQVNQNIHMVASASEEMTASIREIAKNAHQAARVSGSAVDVANSTNQTISKLSDSSSEIGKVIKVISSIAQQTNLLALNATIEAARAGESGRGFAVVANEVKELAKETAKATGDITLKIEAIQADSNCAVQAIAKITQIIQEISDIASTIAGAVEEQSVTTCEISRSVSEAAKGSTEISRVIGGVAISSQNSRIGADETLQAAQSLAVLASQLQKLLGHFRL